MTVYAYQAGRGVGGDIRPTEAEKALWPLFAPYERGKTALWLQAAPKVVPAADGVPARSYPFAVAATALDDPADFWFLDRVGRRRLKAANQHPRLVADGGNGRALMLAPASGIGPMISEAIPNALGAESNDKSLIVPTTGWSFACKFACPPPNLPMNNVYFGATTGGILFGGSSVTYADNLSIRIHSSSGLIQVANRHGTGSPMWQDALATDFRDGQTHTLIAVYDAQANIIRVWMDTALRTGVTGGSLAATTDVVAPAGGSDKATIGAMGGASLTGQYIGFWSAMMFLPAPVFGVQGNRDLVNNVLGAL